MHTLWLFSAICGLRITLVYVLWDPSGCRFDTVSLICLYLRFQSRELDQVQYFVVFLCILPEKLGPELWVLSFHLVRFQFWFWGHTHLLRSQSDFVVRAGECTCRARWRGSAVCEEGPYCCTCQSCALICTHLAWPFVCGEGCVVNCMPVHVRVVSIFHSEGHVTLDIKVIVGFSISFYWLLSSWQYHTVLITVALY